MGNRSDVMKIDVKPEDIQETLREALWIMYKVRKYKKIWDVHYGSQHRANLQTWEHKADEFLDKLIIKPNNDETPA